MSDCWKTFEDLLCAGIKQVILHGPPGIGKTYMACNYLRPEDQPYYKLVCNSGMTTLDIVGGFLPSEGSGVQFNQALALRAFREGWRLVIDEADKASDEVMGELLNLCDSQESAVYRHPLTGEVYHRHPDFVAVITTNYESMAEFPDALRDRFSRPVWIDAPHEGALARFPYRWRGYVKKMSTAGDQRMSLRMFDDLMKAIDAYGEENGAKLILGERAQAFLEALAVDRLTV